MTDEMSGVSFTDDASPDEQKTVAALARELAETQASIEKLTKELEEAKARKQRIAQHDLPNMMSEIGQDKIGLPELAVDAVLRPYYHANIAADWDEERRARAFAALERAGGGDLIKTTITIEAPRHHLKEMQKLFAGIEKTLEKSQLPAVAEIGYGVSWNTLTAFVKAEIEAERPLPLEELGATVGQIVELKKRK